MVVVMVIKVLGYLLIRLSFLYFGSWKANGELNLLSAFFCLDLLLISSNEVPMEGSVCPTLSFLKLRWSPSPYPGTDMAHTLLDDPDIDVCGRIGDACKRQDEDAKSSNSLKRIGCFLHNLARVRFPVEIT